MPQKHDDWCDLVVLVNIHRQRGILRNSRPASGRSESERRGCCQSHCPPGEHSDRRNQPPATRRGNYRFVSLPGAYEDYRRSCFAEVRSDRHLQTESECPDFPKVGAVSESVARAEAPIVDTADSRVQMTENQASRSCQSSGATSSLL
jgi:hypothetical protein